MVQVNNRTVIRSLSLRFIKANRRRNMIAIIAIVLTTVLFTTVFTASFSVIKSTMESEMRKTMDCSHISFEDMTKKQYEMVKKNPEFKKQGVSVFLALAENKELKKLQTEVRFADANGAYSFQSVPNIGRMPLNENEIATSTLVLDAFKLPHKTGQHIKLEVTLNKKRITKNFIVTGIWEGEPIAMSQMIWVSQKYCKSVVPKATEHGLAQGNYAGGYNLCVWISNTNHLDQKAEQFQSRYHLENSNVSISANLAYNIFGEDGFPTISVGLILLIIMFSGYLIIYNIFHISVYTDIRAYGLLKNIGTTGKQLKRIVRQQALGLSLIGIPLGMLVGYFVGARMTPFLLAQETAGSSTPVVLSINPWIFLVSALFSLITVYLGCLKPCRVVGRLSPIEAIRMTETENSSRKVKRTANINPFFMALSNCRRSWKKGVGVVISLFLSLFLLNVVYIIVNGFDFDAYTENMISSDFEINGFASDLRYADMNSITLQFRQQIGKNPDIKAAGYIYFQQGSHKIDNVLLSNIKRMVDARGVKSFPVESQNYISGALENKILDSQVIGINKAIFDKLIFDQKQCSWENFSKGRYVIVPYLPEGKYYDTGDKVTIQFSKKSEKQYKCIAQANLPCTLQYPYVTSAICPVFIIPDTEFIKETGNNHAMIATLDVKNKTSEKVHKWIKKYEKKNNTEFTVNDRYIIRKEFQTYVNKYYMIGYMLTVVLFIISILNFLNTSITSVLSRKRELALLEVVGMTKRDIIKMLSVEGGVYATLAFAFTIFLSLCAGSKVVQAIAGEVYFFRYHFSIWPSIIALPLIFLIVIIIPGGYYQHVCKKVIVERIRNES